MSTEPIELDTEFALDVLYATTDGYTFDHGGHSYTQLTEEQYVSEGRWTVTHMKVFRREDGETYGLQYTVGASDAQDDIEPFEYGAELVPVKSKLVKKWSVA